MEIFAQRLREVRVAVGESQADLAEAIGVKATQVSEMESGKKGTTLERLVVLCRHYHVSADYLLGFTRFQSPYRRQ